MAFDTAKECVKHSEKVQFKLINSVTSALSLGRVDEGLIQKYGSHQSIIKEVLMVYDRELFNIVDQTTYINHIRDFSIQKSRVAIEVAKFAESLGNISDMSIEQSISACLQNYAQTHPNEDMSSLSMSKLLEKIHYKTNQQEMESN